MAAPSARLQSLINTRLIPGAVDSVINYSPTILRFIGNAAKFPAGSRLERPVKVSSTNLSTAFTGLTEFSTVDVPTSIKLTYDIGLMEHSVTVQGVEKLLQSGASDDEKTDLVGYKLEEAKLELGDFLAGKLFTNNDADFVSIRDYADDGGQTTTIGGQTRSNYPALDGVDTASGGTVSLTKIRTLIQAVSEPVAGADATISICTKTVWGLVESLFTPTVVANYQAAGNPMVSLKQRAPVSAGDLLGATGFRSLVFAGIPIAADTKCTSQALYVLDEDRLQWYGKSDPELQAVDLGDDKDLHGVYHAAPSKFHGFNWRPMMDSIDQYGQVGLLFLFGQLVSWEPRRQGVLTGITGA